MQPTLVCLGYGYCATYLARELLPKGWRVISTTRSREKAKTLKAETPDLHATVFDGSCSIDIPDGACWLISIPPNDAGCPAFNALKDQTLTANWIGYLSTTGVYGDLQGGWAYEWSDVAPQSERAKRRVLAETQWQSASTSAHLFRLPGIYGPGRSPLDRVRSGTARRIIKEGQVFSRVHVEDIASCLIASMANPSPSRIYHPCDDEPAPPQDVIAYAAELLAQDIPPDIPFEGADLSPMAKSFYSECKRISNARTKSELGWTPKYSNYRQGLGHLFGDV